MHAWRQESRGLWLCPPLVPSCSTPTGLMISPWMNFVGLITLSATKFRYPIFLISLCLGTVEKLKKSKEHWKMSSFFFFFPSNLSYQHFYNRCYPCDIFCCTQKSFYCLGKTIAEAEALELAKRSGLSMISVCPSIVIGPMLQSTVNASSLLLLTLLKGSIFSSYFYYF